MKFVLAWLASVACLSAALNAASITWLGTNGSTWDTDTTINWNNAGTQDYFFTGDDVTFDDSSTNGTVNLSGILEPGFVTVDNGATAYTFGGTGQIAGSAGLLKSGTGMLTISTANTYTGGTVISAGTIVITNTGALGIGGTTTLEDGNTGANNVSLLISQSGAGAMTFSRPVVVSGSGSGVATIGRIGTGSGDVEVDSILTLKGPVTFQSSTSGTLNFMMASVSGSGNATFTGGGVTVMSDITGASGTSEWTGSMSVTGNSVLVEGTSNKVWTDNRNLSVAAGSAVALNNGLYGSPATGTFGMLTGQGYVGNSGTTTASLTVGAGDVSSTFDGVVGGATIDGYAMGSSLNLVKTGMGKFTMTGANTYTGSTSVSQGTLALSGNGSIANSPSIKVTSGAVLDVSGLTGGSFTIGNGQTLQAGRTSGFANDVVGNLSLNGGTLNIAGSGTAGTLTVSGNLSLGGGTLLYDFANVTTAGAGVNDLISIGGSLLLSGTTTITPDLLNATLADGTYTLISGGSAITGGSGSDLAWGGVLSRQSVIFNTTTTPGTIYMTIAGAAANLIWTGTNGSAWDTGTTRNWNNNGTTDYFYVGDNVTFNDTTTNGNVTLTGTLQPGSVTVSNGATAYTFGGTGQIAGSAGLLKSGTGMLTISTANTYTGGTVISAGTIVMGNTAALGNGGTATLEDGNTGANNVSLLVNQSGAGTVTIVNPLIVSGSGSGVATIGRIGAGSGQVLVNSNLTLNGPVTFQSSTSGTLSLAMGSFSGSGNATFTGGGVTTLGDVSGGPGAWTGSLSVTGNSVLVEGTSNGLWTYNRSVNVAAGSGVALNNSTYGLLMSSTLGMLTGQGYVGNSGTTTTNLTVGGGDVSSTFDGVVGGVTIDGYAMGSSLNLVKTGMGKFTMTGANTYTGSTTVSQGTLALSGNGSIANSPSIKVTSGAVLDVSGLTSGSFTIEGGQTLQAGRTSGFANDVVGNLSLSGGTLNIAGSGTAGTLMVSGNLSLGGGTLLYDFANVTTAGSGVNDMISIGGSLSLSGTTTITPDLLNATLADGTYTLISGGSAITGGSELDLAWGGMLSRQSVIFNTTTTPGTVYMTIAGAAANLVWTGTNGSAWDTGTTGNWNNNGTADYFYVGDNVTFNDTTTNGNVTLTGTLQPGSVTVSNGATAYTFGGTGQIAGSAGLLKSGTGTLTISTANTYTGGTVISAGTIVMGNTAALGNGGTATLEDGNTGANNVSLLVNQSGAGTVTIANPLIVSGSGSGIATIGRIGAGSGEVEVDSILTLNGPVTFQSSTSGTLNFMMASVSGSGNATFTGGGVTVMSDITGASGTSEWTGSMSVTGNSVLVEGTSNKVWTDNRNLSVAAGSGVALNNGLYGTAATGTFGMLTGQGNVGNSGTTTANLTVGGGDASSTFDGVVGGATIDSYAIGSSLNLVKTGMGKFTMTGANTYTGSTTVSQGTLALSGNGSIANSPSIKVTSGAVLDVSGLTSGSFTIGGGQTLQAGRTSGFANDVVGNLSLNGGTLNIVGSGTAGTLTVSGNLSLGGGTLLYDFANVTTAGSGVNDLISIGGSLLLSGTTTITPNFLVSSLTSGTYTIVSGGSAITGGNGSDLAWNGPATRQTVAFDTTTTPGTVYMTVSGSAADLVWSGTAASVWNASTNTWTNVSNAGAPDKFYALDKVVFNDSGATGNVTLAGSLLPGSVTVNNNSMAYTLSGTGQIIGPTTLMKSGSGTLTISTTNSYTGATVVSKGTLDVDGNIASSSAVNLSAGASLSGHGSVGLIAGSGAVAPGDPSILSATQIDPSDGMSFDFEFDQLGSPTYGNASASGNDLLHLIGSNPFVFSLTSANTITIDFSGLTLSNGQVYYGGFFTDADVDDSLLDGATFDYTGLDGANVQYEGLVTVPSAAFATGTVSGGDVMEFRVVPEPDVPALLGISMIALLALIRRPSRASQTR